MPAPERAASRRRRRAAVLGPPGGAGPAANTAGVATGIVLDASPHLLILGNSDGETRLAMSDATTVWHGGHADPAALRPGRPVIARLTDAGRGAEKVWVGISRVSGTILTCGRDAVEVDMGPHRGRAHVAIPPRVREQVLVRHPRLEPGYLIDVICVRSPGGPRAVRPGTSQPGYRADGLAAPAATAPVPEVLRGTATWFGDCAEGESAPDGAAYPAVDSEGDAGGCADAPSGCVAFPYLSLGSDVAVRNECGGRAATIPVVECGCMAARFCDRCVDCDASPRGRIVELSPAAFARLGGELESGCFNAAVRPAGRATSW